jgi:succinate dehydrogenase / fumarate reductase, cytochrome b subunit
MRFPGRAMTRVLMPTAIAVAPMSDSELPGKLPRAARPVYLNLFAIRQPIPAIVSILHRVSGALLFLVGIPLLLWAVQQSLTSSESYAALQASLARPIAKLLLLGLAWAYLHHFCAGIRYLLLDLHIGTELTPSRQSSYAVLIVSLALTAIVGARLW